jgi:2-polyprenyl-3-methyl-5-hydroxy-6-metoxy-1,4-benzoquinol methylase
MMGKLKSAAISLLIRGNRFRILRPFLWKYIAQPLELQFHIHDGSRRGPDSEQFKREIADLFEYFGFRPDQYSNKTIVDIGAGSHLTTSFFRDARIVAVEPLGDQYLKEIPSCGLSKAHKVYSCPAETRIEELRAAADFAISINVLDHVFAFERIVDNIYFYLKPGSTAFLSFDCHDYTTAFHPTSLTEERCRRVFESAGFSIAKVSRGLGPPRPCAIPLGSAYGDGEAVSFWLTKPNVESNISWP